MRTGRAMLSVAKEFASMRPKVAFVSLWDAADPNAESGYAYSMRRQLQKRFDVVDLFPLGLPGERLWWPLRLGYRLAGRYYHPMREPTVLKALARRILGALRTIRPDAVFAPSSLPMTFVESRIPVVYATDQLFRDFVGTYVRSPSSRFLSLGDAQERRALAAAAGANFPSDRAARTAIDHYGADSAKITVIPWGANLPREIGDETVAAAIGARPLDRCHLVFVGRDWRRKGGDTLRDTVAELNRMGVETHATLIGCDPPGLPPGQFTVLPFLDKRRPADFARFVSVMLKVHFFVLPSRAEAYGQAFCEAAAFGLPLIGSTAGGIPTIIRDGKTGYTMPADTPAREFAARIRDTLADGERYVRMALAARADYRERLNWDRYGERLGETIAALV
jgi:glycosyltransferase involved in cell wall biosynthesis